MFQLTEERNENIFALAHCALRGSNGEEGRKWISSNFCRISVFLASKAFPVYIYPESLWIKEKRNKPKPKKTTQQMLEFIEVQRAGRKGLSWERGLSQGWWIIVCLMFLAQKASHPPLIHLLLSLVENFSRTCFHSGLNMCFLTHLSLNPFPLWIHHTFVASNFWINFTVQMKTIKIQLFCFH